MKIATWNVNSVRARLGVLNDWIKKTQPDVLLLQETKCQEGMFPYGFFEDLGYTCQVVGQKAYNGVAVVSRPSLEDCVKGLPTFPEDTSARYLEVLVGGRIRVISLYVPNGGPEVGSDYYKYKLKFLEKLRSHLNKISVYNEAILLGGDINIAPTNDDVYDESIWHDRVCCTKEEREALQQIMDEGYQDLLVLNWRQEHPEGKHPFTWWDYRSRAFDQNRGLRLDLMLGNELTREYLVSIGVDSTVRGFPQPSDHAPVVLTLANLM